MRRSRRRPLTGVVVAVLVVLAGGGAAWYLLRPSDDAQQSSSVTRIPGPMPTAEPGSEVEPATAGPSQVSEPAPDEPVATDPEPATGGGDVDVVATWSGWVDDPAGVEVSGFVSGVVESGGTCRLTLTHAGSTVTAEQPGEPDASTTVCPTLQVPAAQLTTGSWQAVLTYSSPTSSGTSAASTVEVPAR
jgi:hypothetical protein